MPELKDKMPRAADILHEQYKNHIKGFDSIYPDRFPVAYNSIAIDAMHEYCKQLIDVIAESKQIEVQKIMVVPKEVILKFKELLK